jgi:hypothetical protein
MMTPLVKPSSLFESELGAIHFSNQQYWSRKERSHEGGMQHQMRQERLEQVRKEMNELENG